MNNIFDKYKLFDIDPSSLRSENFYLNMINERKSYWKSRKQLIKEDFEAKCLLCKCHECEFYLEYEQYKLFKCSSCGAIFPNIHFDGRYISLVYDHKIYEENIRREVLSTYDYRKNKFGVERLEYIKQKCNFNDNDKLLDLGCGPGYFLKYLAENDIKGKGLELTEYLVDICKEKGLNVESTKLEDENDDSYSVITMFDVLEHLIDPLDFFKTANKKLKKDGSILAYTPNINSFAFYFQKGKQNLLLPYEHVLFYSKESLEYLAKKTGFKIKSIEYYGLDIIDYFSMKQFEDEIPYNKKLKEIIPYLQALIDKENISNHMRVVFKKI